MTSINEAKEAVYSRFTTQWAAGSNLPFCFGNEAFDPPTTAWVRLVVRHTAGQQDTLGPEGGRRFRRLGNIIAQVFVPIDTGEQDADAYGREITGIFEGTSFDGVSCQAADYQEIGPDGKWFQANITVPLWAEETK